MWIHDVVSSCRLARSVEDPWKSYIVLQLHSVTVKQLDIHSSSSSPSTLSCFRWEKATSLLYLDTPYSTPPHHEEYNSSNLSVCSRCSGLDACGPRTSSLQPHQQLFEQTCPFTSELEDSWSQPWRLATVRAMDDEPRVVRHGLWWLLLRIRLCQQAWPVSSKHCFQRSLLSLDHSKHDTRYP